MGEVRIEQRGRVLVATMDNPPHGLMDTGIVEGLQAGDRIVSGNVGVIGRGMQVNIAGGADSARGGRSGGTRSSGGRGGSGGRGNGGRRGSGKS